MRQRKFTFLLVALLVVSGLLFAGGEAGAAISYNLTTSPATSSSAFVSDATYYYTLTKNAGSQDISYALFEIPVAINITNPANYSVASGGATVCSKEVIAPGVGDAGSKFGYGDLRYRLLKLGFCNPSSTINISLTLKGSFGTGFIFGSDPQGAFEIKPSQGTVQNFLTVTPLGVPQPVTPPPVITSFYASPTPVQKTYSDPTPCSTLYWFATSGTVVISSPAGQVAAGGSNGSAEVCAATTTEYTAIATSAEGPSAAEKTTVSVIDPVGPAQVTDFKATPPTITSGQQPLCVTLSWSGTTGTVAISSVPGGPLASGLPPTGTYTVCPVVTTDYTATASSSGGTSTATTTVPVDPPVLQTSCTQIVKIPKDPTQPESCVSVCYELGGEKKMVSADLFDNRFCDDTPPPNCVPNVTCPAPREPLAIFDPNSGDPVLRVRSVQCSPCGITATSGAKSVVCVENHNQSQFPFTIDDLTHVNADGTTKLYSVRCDQMLAAVESSGFTIDLSKDPCRYDGSTNFCWACPAGYRDTGTRCVKP